MTHVPQRLEHPYVGLIFLVPGHKNITPGCASAEIVRDPDAANG
ncbi:MAG: hypothetical protein R2697_07595 [Ilumatobacteraceae bacterium]